MITSARKQLTGTVSAIKTGAVNDEIDISLPNGQSLVATVTHSSVQYLNLHQGGEAIAFIKAPWVILTAADSGLRFSARNQFSGTIKSIVTGAINSEVAVEIDPTLTLISVITNESVTGLGLKPGDAITALIKASSIVLATRG